MPRRRQSGHPPWPSAAATRTHRHLCPATGLARRCGPLSLLGSSLLLIVGGLAITDVRVAAACVAVELLLAPLVFGWARPSVRLIPGLLAVASVGFSNWLL